MNDHRWGFEEADDWEDLAPSPPRSANGSANGSADDSAEALTGQDPDGVVTVAVGPDAGVLSVTLAENWRGLVDPRALHHSVRAAANNATMQALASRVQAEPPPQAPQSVAPAGPAGNAPITREDALRLMAAVDAELADFSRQLSAVADQRVTAESAGRHVSGSALRGQVVDVSIDANWAASARAAEIETELVDVLRRLHRMSTPTELAGGPQGQAITELNALLSDPQALLRRVGLLPAPAPRGEN
jgi:hypothetical protein